jgi:hypothetical protein
VPELVRRLVADGVAVRAVVPAVEQGLEEFFLGLTQSSDADGGRGEPAADAAAGSPAGGPQG